MPLANPWLILIAALAFAAAVLGSYSAGNLHGHAAEKLAWEAAIAGQRAEAGELLAKSETRRAETERALDALKDKVELDNADAERRIEAAYTANRLLLAGGRGLRDPQGTSGRACRGDGMSTDSASTRRDSNTPAGCRLSDAAAQFLLALARDADHAAATAAACRDWAISLGAAAKPQP